VVCLLNCILNIILKSGSAEPQIALMHMHTTQKIVLFSTMCNTYEVLTYEGKFSFEHDFCYLLSCYKLVSRNKFTERVQQNMIVILAFGIIYSHKR
jgi:hypothetical protein